MSPRKKTTRRQTPPSAPLAALAKAFDATPIIYGTGGPSPEQHWGAKIASDALPLLAEHLEAIGRVQRIALVIHSKGGALETPWPLVNMIRHHCDEFLALVPELALSGGTLIALGAESVFMLPDAFLSPVDPTQHWKEAGETKGLSIEDVLGYVDFVTQRIGIRDQAALVEVLKELTRHVDPIKLGSVHRTCSLIERLSRNMLQLHLRELKDAGRVEQIVEFLTHKLFTHNHLIPVEEARDVVGLGDLIPELTQSQTRAMISARSYIRRTLRHHETLNVADELAKVKKNKIELAVNRAMLVSSTGQHLYVSKRLLFKDPPDSPEIKMQPISDGWHRI